MQVLLTKNERFHLAAQIIADPAIRSGKAGKHNAQPFLGKHVKRQGSSPFRLNDLSWRKWAAVRVLKRAGLSEMQACRYCAQWMLEPAHLKRYGIAEWNIERLRKLARSGTAASGARGRRSKPIKELRPATRVRLLAEAERGSPSFARAVKAARATLEGRSDDLRRVGPLSREQAIQSWPGGLNSVPSLRGRVVQLANSIRSALSKYKPEPGFDSVEFQESDFWWTQPFHVGDRSPLTGQPLDGAEFPSGWLRHSILLFGFLQEVHSGEIVWQLDRGRYSRLAGLNGWPGAAAGIEAIVEWVRLQGATIARGFGHLPQREIGPW